MGTGEAHEAWRKTVEKTLKSLLGIVKVESALLFGSWSRGGGGEWSDVDLLIVSSDVKNLKVLDRFKLAVEIASPKADVFLYTFEELETMVKRGNPLALSALIEGKPIILSQRVEDLIKRAKNAYTRTGRAWIRQTRS